jgi:hypothetical protein
MAKFPNFNVRFTTEVADTSEDGPMLFMPESSKLNWAAAGEDGLDRLQSAWLSESFLTFAPEFPMFILGREPTVIHYSELEDNLGFILWRWGYAPEGWHHPNEIQAKWCHCIQPEFPFCVDERLWILCDPLYMDLHTAIDIKSDKLFISTFRYAPDENTLMHMHLFCANSMKCDTGLGEKMTSWTESFDLPSPKNPMPTPAIQRRWKNLPGEPVGDAGDAQ